VADSTDNTLRDKLAVREVLDEYCLRLEVDAFGNWLDLFTEDSVYEVYGKILQGRREIEGMLSKAPHGVHLGGPARIELDGDTAETIQSYAFYGNDPKYSNKGWYYRTLVRTGAGWKIAHTRVSFQQSSNKNRE